MPQTIYAPLLTKGINHHGGLEYNRIPKTWPKLFHIKTTKSRNYFVQNWIPLSMPTERTPGAPFGQDSVRPDFDKKFTVVDYGKLIVVANEDIDDDQYGMMVRWASSTGGLLAMAYVTLEEWQMANYFAVTGISTTSPAPESPDGDPLFSTSHPMSASDPATTWSNRAATATQLSMAGLQGARANLDSQFMANNETFISNSMKYLVVNPQFEEIALQLRNATYTSADNQPNTLKGSFDVISWPYFRQTMTGSAAGVFDGWFVQGHTHDMYMIDREGVTHDDDKDTWTNSHIYNSRRRFTRGHTDARGMFSGWG